ncbi:hypothetical protein COV19_06485 [Candidatus Woesearchaeota archaeon CG10_big_fil_rev_8_21_14_0_10_44_13]|nr:MAG: hypothetical protein COV19_06485 [Candidatus Woesearchaeota archaeon CG10_big_fil_rev_8_21_14_0_10_44_13]
MVKRGKNQVIKAYSAFKTSFKKMMDSSSFSRSFSPFRFHLNIRAQMENSTVAIIIAVVMIFIVLALLILRLNEFA